MASRQKPQPVVVYGRSRSTLARTRQHLDDLRGSEKKVAQHVLEAPEKVIYQSISELAENAGTSEPTVLIAHLSVIDVLAIGAALRRSRDFFASVRKTQKALAGKPH